MQEKTPKICVNPKCGKIIVEDWFKWLEENRKDKWLECPYCGTMEQIRS